MTTPALKGTLTMRTALIDWRDESARCVGLFRSSEAAALEVEYRVALDLAVLDFLARAFATAGLPILRGKPVPVALPVGVGEDGLIPARGGETEAKIDRRTRAYRLSQQSGAGPANGDGDSHA